MASCNTCRGGGGEEGKMMGLLYLLLVSLVISEAFSHTLSSCTEETQVFQHPLHSQCVTLPPMCIPSNTGNSEHT